VKELDTAIGKAISDFAAKLEIIMTKFPTTNV
jgi:hypothetical protein